MGYLDLFSKKQSKANNKFLANQRGQQAIAKIEKLDLPANIKKQLITASVFDMWFNEKELAPLIDLLKDEKDEIIEYIATGINEKSKTVMLVCTNQRLIILSKKMLAGEKARVIALKQIKSVIFKKQIFYGEITLIEGYTSLDINSINKVSAPILAKTIKKWSKLAQGSGTDALDQQVEQIKKLKTLLDQGILTEEEFQAKKKQILGL